jgi:long-chain acyl-CoA synthetase
VTVESSGVPAGSGRVVAALARAIEHALAETDLSLSQYRLLALLEDEPAVASVIADRLTVTRPSVTAVVDGLVARRYVTRAQDDEDRRRVTQVLTDEGRAQLARADEVAESVLAELLGDVADNRQRAAVAAGVHAWQDVISRRSAEGLAAWRSSAAAEATR